jgi:hypothetical protein
LGIVIRFARYLRAEDVGHDIPLAVFGAEKRSRPVPYILSHEQIRQLVEAASRSGYRTLRRETYKAQHADPGRRSVRAQRDDEMRAVIRRVWTEHFQVCGPREKCGDRCAVNASASRAVACVG